MSVIRLAEVVDPLLGAFAVDVAAGGGGLGGRVGHVFLGLRPPLGLVGAGGAGVGGGDLLGGLAVEGLDLRLDRLGVRDRAQPLEERGELLGQVLDHPGDLTGDCTRSRAGGVDRPGVLDALDGVALSEALTGTPRDREMANPFTTDLQIAALRQARTHRGDKLVRDAAPHRVLDSAAGPLIAVRLHVLTRKILGGIETDLDARVLRPDGAAPPGLDARPGRWPVSVAAACTATARSRARSAAGACSPGGRQAGPRRPRRPDLSRH